jgi:hypothetical protein
VSRALPEIPVPELSALVRAVRGCASTARSDKELRTPALLFPVILATLLHSAGGAAWISREAHSRASVEESKMKFSARGVVMSSALALSSASFAQDAVQWRLEDGGNGHWYAITSSGVSFDQAEADATQVGAHLVTILSAAEQNFIETRIANTVSFLNAWMGLRQDENAVEPSGGWGWITGEPLSGYSNWWLGVPQPDNNACGSGIPENFAMWAKQWGGAWADVTADTVLSAPCSGPQTHSLLEWSADCNNDGIVDYGQIRAGELADANANNIPDCCESGVSCDPCPGDVDGSGAVNGVDLAAILNNWGTDGGKYPGADTNQDGVIDGADLAAVLSAWGPCP